MSAFKYFTFIIMIQLFYSFGATLLTHALQPFNVNPLYLQEYQNISTDITNITGRIESTTQSQLNIPLIDLGALVFYSGNIIVDLMLNFFFALPSMLTILVTTFTNIFSLDAYLASQLKLFVFSIVSILYFLNLLAFILNIRSRGSIV